jgi:hypothetical protein
LALRLPSFPRSHTGLTSWTFPMHRSSHLSFLAASYDIQREFMLALHSYRAQQAILASQQSASAPIPNVSEPSSSSVSNSIIRRRMKNTSSQLLRDISSRLTITTPISSSLPPASADSLVAVIPQCSHYDTITVTKRASPNTSLTSNTEENTSKRPSKASDFSLPRPLNDSKPVASVSAVAKLTTGPFRNKLISSTGRQKVGTNYGNTANGARQNGDVQNDAPEEQPPQQPAAGFKGALKVHVRSEARIDSKLFLMS